MMEGFRRELHTCSGITDNHLVVGFKASCCQLRHRVLLMTRLGGRDDGSIGDQRKVDPGVGHQVGLELIQINIESTLKPRCDL